MGIVMPRYRPPDCPPDEAGADVACDRHHGDAVHICRGDARDKVCRTRAARCQNHTCFSCGAGVAVGPRVRPPVREPSLCGVSCRCTCRAHHTNSIPHRRGNDTASRRPVSKTSAKMSAPVNTIPAPSFFPHSPCELFSNKQKGPYLDLTSETKAYHKHSAVPLRLPHKTRPLGAHCSIAARRLFNGAKPAFAYTGIAPLGEAAPGRLSRAPPAASHQPAVLCARTNAIRSLHCISADIVFYYIHGFLICQTFFEKTLFLYCNKARSPHLPPLSVAAHSRAVVN